MKAKVQVTGLYAGIQETEYKGAKKLKFCLIQDGEIIQLTIPEDALEEVLLIDTGKTITVDAEFGTFYDRNSKRNISYQKYVPVYPKVFQD